MSMSSDLVGFSAILLIALSSVVLMMTSVANWWQSGNTSNRAGVPGQIAPCGDRVAVRETLAASTSWRSVLLVVVFACSVASAFSHMSTPILPARRILISLAAALLAGLVIWRLWSRRQPTAS